MDFATKSDGNLLFCAMDNAGKFPEDYAEKGSKEFQYCKASRERVEKTKAVPNPVPVDAGAKVVVDGRGVEADADGEGGQTESAGRHLGETFDGVSGCAVDTGGRRAELSLYAMACLAGAAQYAATGDPAPA